MKKTTLKILTLLVGFSLILSGCSLLGGSTTTIKAEKVTLEFWGVFDTPEAYADIIKSYTTAHPNITINYKKLRWEEYESELLNAWAEDRGPDIFMVHNSWVGKYQTKLFPMPAETKIPILIEKKSAFKNTTETSLEVKKTPTPEKLKELFVPTVYGDAVRGNQIWGLPLAVDSLVLFYNRALFNTSNVIAPPKTWTELSGTDSISGLAKTITRVDPANNQKIVRSAVAMGTASNNNRALDLVSLLMMQRGEILVDTNGLATYNSKSKSQGGESALGFYLSFANPQKQNYTWNDSLATEATDSFVQGRLAMMFGYVYQYPFLRAQAPSLDIGIAGVPHLSADGSDYYSGQSVNLANYWLLGVAKKSKHPNEAWGFINFATMDSFANAKNILTYRAESYLASNAGITTKLRTPALRSLVAKYKDDEKFQPALSQVLTAKSWYRGKDPGALEQSVKQFINDFLYNNRNIRDAANLPSQLLQN